jgi:beta-1,2-mannosidase
MNRRAIGAALLAAAVAVMANAAGEWTLGPFVKAAGINPVLSPSEAKFRCPLAGKEVAWEDRYVYNPAAVARNDKVYLLYRAQGSLDGEFSKTSRIGLAESADGIHFERRSAPVLYPDRDFMAHYEWPGGCEDPRVVEAEDGKYYLTYSAFDGTLSRLCVASSSDLVHWTKHGPAFRQAFNGWYVHRWSKSGAIVTELRGGRPIATKLNGKYWMYWGDSNIYLASSDDLINWTPMTAGAAPRLRPVLEPRRGNFDSRIVESGPPALLTEAGIVLIYNSKNRDLAELPDGAYAAGQALFDRADPAALRARTDSYFMHPEFPFETDGLVPNVVFLEGLVFLPGKSLLYYGAADSRIGMASE